MSDDKPLLDYYGIPLRKKRGYGPLRTGLGIAGLAMLIMASRMPLIPGTGVTALNFWWNPAWILAISLLVAYFWVRLREDSPGFDIPRFIMGIGATGTLANLLLMLIMWKPPFPLLIKLCIAFLLLAVVGRVLKRRKT